MVSDEKLKSFSLENLLYTSSSGGPQSQRPLPQVGIGVTLKQHHTLSSLFRKPKDVINFEQSVVWCIKFLAGIAMLCM